jgi:hypothetical protein
LSNGDSNDYDKVIPKLPDLSQDLETLLGSGKSDDHDPSEER